MEKSVDIKKIVKELKKEFKNFKTPIVDLIKVQTKSPFKVLITTILSARTQDGVTAKVAKRLFDKIKKVSDLRKYSIKDIEDLIYPIGFYKNKAKFLSELPDTLKQFDNKVPQDIDSLLKLPGVGRKTANLVRAVAFEKPAICVDVHVHRIMNRIGYVDTKTPFETEMRLRKKLPKKYWLDINSIMVAHGQNICRPITPICSKCKILDNCNRVNVNNSK